jgi:hypothetical protein
VVSPRAVMSVVCMCVYADGRKEQAFTRTPYCTSAGRARDGEWRRRAGQEHSELWVVKCAASCISISSQFSSRLILLFNRLTLSLPPSLLLPVPTPTSTLASPAISIWHWMDSDSSQHHSSREPGPSASWVLCLSPASHAVVL